MIFAVGKGGEVCSNSFDVPANLWPRFPRLSTKCGYISILNKSTPVGIMVCAVKNNEKVTLKKSLTSVLNFGIAKGLETNKESASYTEIKIKLHKILESFPFQNFAIVPALDPCHLRGLFKTGTVNLR